VDHFQQNTPTNADGENEKRLPGRTANDAQKIDSTIMFLLGNKSRGKASALPQAVAFR
jgi:hypothetical protein